MNDAGARLVCSSIHTRRSGQLVDAATSIALANELSRGAADRRGVRRFRRPGAAATTRSNLVRAFDNVLLLRTLVEGLFARGTALRLLHRRSPTLIEPMLTKTRDSYNVDAIAQTIACAGLRRSRIRRRIRGTACARERRRIARCAARARLRRAAVAIELPAGDAAERRRRAGALYEALKRRGILVRYFDAPRLDDKIRITVGDPHQNDRLISAIDEIMRLTGDVK